MSNKHISETILQLLKNMDFSPSIDSDKIALEWMEKHNKTFYGFVFGAWLNREEIEKIVETEVYHHQFCDHFSDNFLCDVYFTNDIKLITYASKRSSEDFTPWSSLSPSARSIILYKIAETITKYQSLFSVVESLSSGKHLYKTKTKDIPNLIESFSYYAGCTLDHASALYPAGCVCVIAEEYNNPLLTLSWRICSLLASRNSVLLLTDIRSCLSAFLLAEICHKSGLPPGALNVLPIDVEFFDAIGTCSVFSKLVFTGSLYRAKAFSELCSKSHLPCEVLVPRRPVVIVYEDGDLPSAASGVLEAFFFHDTRCTSGGCKVMIQESIYEEFLKLLKNNFDKILIGRNTLKSDLSCIVTNKQKNYLSQTIEEMGENNVKIHRMSNVSKCDYIHMIPQIIIDGQTNCKLVHEELGGPIIVSIPFRTVKESVSMFNCDNKGSPVSVWSERIAVAVDVARKLKSGIVWLNSQNLISPSVAFSGVYLSGNSVEGGQAGYFSHMSAVPGLLGDVDSNQDDKYDSWLSSCKELYKSASAVQITFGTQEYMTEYKLYINGSLILSDNGSLVLNKSALLPNGSEADVQNAISSALAAQSKWEGLSRHQKSQILFSIIDNINKNKEQFITELHDISEKIDVELQEALAIFHYWAVKHDKYSGETQEMPGDVKIIQDKNPLGVIGIVCPNEKPLLSFLSLLAPAIMFGNTVVAIASEKNPIPVLKICQIFHLSCIPAGVINVVSGNPSRLIPHLCKHKDINTIWYSDVPCKVIYTHSHITQRVFNCKDIWNNFDESKSLKCISESTFTKAIYLPMGEIFAN